MPAGGLVSSACPFPRTPFSASGVLPSLRSGQVSLAEAEHFLRNRSASVATLRWCSGSSRNAVRLPFGMSISFAGIPNGHHEYVFPAKPNPRIKINFKRPHAWDRGKRFRRVARRRGSRACGYTISGTSPQSTLTSAGVADNIIQLVSWPVSETVDLIAKVLQEP